MVNDLADAFPISLAILSAEVEADVAELRNGARRRRC
jgi:hypothetical protein